jgi:hypothetical protein
MARRANVPEPARVTEKRRGEEAVKAAVKELKPKKYSP